MRFAAITLILCMFGFLKEFRPSEPFVYHYLTGPWKNYTFDEVTRSIYPIGTYSNLATLVIVFLLTDLVRYKPMIILCGLTGIVTFTLLLLGRSLAAMQCVEFAYGLYLSTEVAYYTYIYTKVDKNHYQAVSSYTRSALLLGRFVTGLVAQLLVSFQLLDYEQLIYLTIFGQVSATIWALFLPSVGQSIYFHRIDTNVDNQSDKSADGEQNRGLTINPAKPKISLIAKVRKAYVFLWQDFVKAYTNPTVLKWSAWWAASSCGYLQELFYVQSIWEECVNKRDDLYNGAVEALATLIDWTVNVYAAAAITLINRITGASAVFAIGQLKLNWMVIGETMLSVFALVEACLLFFISQNKDIWIQYACHIVFGVVYHAIVTICSSEVAKRVSDDSFGLIFGVNIFVTLSLQSVLTALVTDKSQNLPVRTQFAIYAGYFTVLGGIFTVMAVITITRLCKRRERPALWLGNTPSLVDN